MDPFATALDALFAAPGSVAAVYTVAGGQPLSIRTICDQRTQDLVPGSIAVPIDTNLVLIRRSQVARPMSGDTIRVGSFSAVFDTDPLFDIVGEARLDVEGLTWSCEMLPA